MVFSDTANNTGLIQYCEQNIYGDGGYGKISGDTGRLQSITNYINEAYSRYVNIARSSDGKWQFDDTNYLDYPFAVTNLIANQQDYPFLVSFLDITSIEIQNTGGVWYTLSEVDEREMANDHISLTQRFIVPSQPWVFNRTSNSIFLLPAPNYNLVGGLKVRYQRPPSYFTYLDTNKVPGFAETLHPYLSNYATWRYLASKGMPGAANFLPLVTEAEQTLIPNFYLSREKDTTKKLYPKYTNRH